MNENLPIWKMALLASPNSFGAIPANFTSELLPAKNNCPENKISQNEGKEKKLTLYYTEIKERHCVDEYLEFSESLATAYFRNSKNKGEKIFLQGNIFLAKLAKAIFAKDGKFFVKACGDYADESYFSECVGILEKQGFVFEKRKTQEESWLDLYNTVLLLTEEYLSVKYDLPIIEVFECEENSKNSEGLKIIFTPQNTNEEQLKDAVFLPLKSVHCSSDFLAIGANFFDFLSKNFPCQNNEYEFTQFMEKIYDYEVCEDLSWLYRAVISNNLPFPESFSVGVMEANKLGAYKDKKIYINHRLALNALRSPNIAYLLLLTMLHEYGHFLDDVLHEKAKITGDSHSDEGKIFASRFIEYSESNLLNSDFKFADFLAPDQEDRKQIFTLEISNLSYEEKKGIECIFEFSESLGNGNLKLPSEDTEIQDVEFLGLINATNATSKTHQNITMEGAKTKDVLCNNFLTDGSIWPDFPTETHLETNIPLSLITLALGKSFTKRMDIIYESHYGKNQHWHSMCPKLSRVPNNAGVAKQILEQAETWYSEAIKEKGNNTEESLFALGKLCHMVQDSFVLAHCWRRYIGDEYFIEETKIEEKDNGKIWTFQDYSEQDGSLHAYADAPKQEGSIKTIGYESAVKATEGIMARYVKGQGWKEISTLSSPENYLKDIYALCSGRESSVSGGTHPWFSKNSGLAPKKLKELLVEISEKVKNK